MDRGMQKLSSLIAVALSLSSAATLAAESSRLVIVATVEGRKALYNGTLSLVLNSTSGERPSECENGLFWTTSVALRGGDLIHSCDGSSSWRVRDGYTIGWVPDKSTGTQLPIVGVATSVPVPSPPDEVQEVE